MSSADRPRRALEGPRLKWALYGALAVALIVLPFAVDAVLGRAWVRIIDVALLFIMLALGLNIVVGYAGVPLGAFLSGGIDSSAVVAMMSRVSSVPVKTFSIGFEEPEYDELKYAREAARRFGTEHHELIVRPEALAVLPKLAWHYDEPLETRRPYQPTTSPR